VPADLVILAIGVKPETELAKAAGLQIGSRGGIVVDDQMRTSDAQMRERYAVQPTDREIWTCCGVGQRAYFATRFLMQHGYRSRNLSGGYTTYQAFLWVPPQAGGH
jgi:rhodanese-related sulfurtransferase